MIGIDIVQISRIDYLITKFNDKFLKRVFTKHEIAQSDKYKYMHMKVKHFAKRFAAKEAYVKALGRSAGIEFRNIGIVNDSNGKPHFYLNNTQLINVEVSLSDDGDYAIAMVMLTKQLL